MRLDITNLTALRRQHPAWKLLLSDHAPLIASFLHRVFVAPNVRYMSAANLSAALEDELFALREQQGEGGYPRSAQDYLNDWAENERGWLRKFYPEASDEAHFELTPATESVIAWLSSLTGKAFIGTESRLLTLFELLRQMSLGSETNPSVRVKELYKRRDEIDADIARTLRGSIDQHRELRVVDGVSGSRCVHTPILQHQNLFVETDPLKHHWNIHIDNAYVAE